MDQAKLWSAINVSEGRDHRVLQALAEGLESRGALLADWSSDSDHHRSVFSLIGTATELRESVLHIFSWASEHLDLSLHQGVHPRLGAVDVIPFVPLSTNSSLKMAQNLALELAETVASQFDIPTFLYRDSSTSETVLTLPELRRGGPLSLRERLLKGELSPNFGPSEPHPKLGVSIFGARGPLTAFNCVINTTNLEMGREIARAIRASSGGIAQVQALAFVLDSKAGLVQISMNILDPEETPPHVAYLAVVETCRERGLEVLSSELIGLMQLEALRKAFQHFTKMDEFRISQVAEWNLIAQDQGGKEHDS